MRARVDCLAQLDRDKLKGLVRRPGGRHPAGVYLPPRKPSGWILA
eukprot:SAG22_NODE_1400_length_4502_cov_10.780831_1_plen_45_part_00